MNYFDYRKRNYERLQQNEDNNSYINAHNQMQHQIDNLTQLLSQAQQLAMSQQLAIVQRKHSFWDRFFKR